MRFALLYREVGLYLAILNRAGSPESHINNSGGGFAGEAADFARHGKVSFCQSASIVRSK